MLLRLKDVLIIVLSPNTPGKYAKRLEHMKTILEGYKWAHFESIKNSDHLKSGALSFAAILSKNMETPVIILEDDCSWYETPPETLHIPDDADAVYLGLSSARVHPTYDWCVPQPTVTAVTGYPHLVRIYDMLSMHAILYISEEFKEKCRRELQYFEHNPCYGWDIPIARSLRHFNVYAYKKPLLYQDITYGGGEQGTRWEIDATCPHVAYLL